MTCIYQFYDNNYELRTIAPIDSKANLNCI